LVPRLQPRKTAPGWAAADVAHRGTGYGRGVERRPPARSLRASDADRERVVAVLASAAADGRLTLEEHSQRVTLAYSARTLGELAELTSDLAESSAQPFRLDSWRPALGIFGNDARSGRWVVPENFTATAIFGEVSLDLTEALLQRPHVTMHVTAIFGSVHLLVPDGVNVRITGPVIIGSRVNHVPSTQDAPDIDVRAFTVFGKITARRPKRRRWRRPGFAPGVGRIRRRAVDGS
jgi:DUF1707 SHOCT-like domain/Cell wall-active antibiotics response LiaF, C-terminal